MKQSKQYFEHYEKWEDYKAGMFRLNDKEGKYRFVFDAVNLLRNPDNFKQACLDLLEAWPIAAKVNLTNLGQNRRAWLGAAACCFKYNTPEYLTRVAWNLLDEKQQKIANNVADSIILQYEQSQNKTNHAKTLFDDQHI